MLARYDDGMDSALRALAEPTRREILRLVRDRERTSGDIAAHFDVSRPAVSQHLRVLKDAGLVLDEPSGTRRIYRVAPDGLAALRADLERFWGKALANYKTAVEKPSKEKE